MKLRETPAQWRQGFRLYRRRTGEDSLGNAAAYYNMDAPDEDVPAAEGLDFQSPKGWNSSGRLGSAGARVEETGEIPGGGVLEGYLRSSLAVSAFDRLEVGGGLFEVRGIHRWPQHQKLMLQRLK